MPDPHALVIIPINNIAIDGNVGDGIKIDRHFRLYKSLASSRVKTVPPELKSAIGTLDADAIMQCRAIAIYDGSMGDVGQQAHAIQMWMRKLIAQVSHATTMLWLEKSNAAEIDGAYSLAASRTTRLLAYDRFFLPDQGHNQVVVYEAASVAGWFRSSSELLGGGNFTHATHPMHPPASHPTTPRMNRVITSITAARAEYDLDRRIALWVTMLETLLSSGSTELTHRLSERVAVLTVGGATEKIDAYKLVRDAYKVRSSTVHGDVLSSKLFHRITLLSVQIEDLARSCMDAVMKSAELLNALQSDKSEVIDQFFLERLLTSPA